MFRGVGLSPRQGARPLISTPPASWKYSSTHTPASQYHAMPCPLRIPITTTHGDAGRPSEPGSSLSRFRLRVNAYLGSLSARTPTCRTSAPAHPHCQTHNSFGIGGGPLDHGPASCDRHPGRRHGRLPNQSPKRLLIQQLALSTQSPAHVIYPHWGKDKANGPSRG